MRRRHVFHVAARPARRIHGGVFHNMRRAAASPSGGATGDTEFVAAFPQCAGRPLPFQVAARRTSRMHGGVPTNVQRAVTLPSRGPPHNVEFTTSFRPNVQWATIPNRSAPHNTEYLASSLEHLSTIASDGPQHDVCTRFEWGLSVTLLRFPDCLADLDAVA